MAFTAGADRTTGDVVTATIWNGYNGSSGSIDVLKGYADLLNTLTRTNALSVDGTAYQNDTTKMWLVTLPAYMDTTEGIIVYCDAANPPTTEVGRISNNTGGDTQWWIHFMVPPGYYYKVVHGGAVIMTPAFKWARH